MSAIVIDSSVALAWCFDDEASDATDRLLDRVGDEGAIVPTLWHLELANVLLKASKRGRVTSDEIRSRLALFDKLAIEIDIETTAYAWIDILSLAQTEGLTTYDAAYLELALRRGADLFTKDAALAEAARRRGVRVYPS